MTSAQIRQSFLDFFQGKQHTIVPSSSLMPDSPNLLFTNAGMNQFVPIFLGETPCPYSPGRAADTQKCIRAGGKHNDLEDVGLDTYHHTLFEMLGNWSFGDYFKKEAIEWAWELVTGVWKFPVRRIYATVYKPGPGDPSEFDQEAWDHWARLFSAAGLDPAVHIVNGNKKDNFWMMGDTGPCGPCSEIHIDLTPDGNTKGSLVNAGDPRCIEIWNLVFIQFNANPDGTFSTLPARHVDTGMGFERVASIIQCTKNFTDFTGTISNYETDVFSPLFREIEKISGRSYTSTLPKQGLAGLSAQERADVAFRVIADHIRTLSCAVADGILPGNEGRNYVLRRILRRAVLWGRALGLHEPFFHKLVPAVVASLGGVFPELRTQQAVVEKVLKAEEENFNRTLDRGIELFQSEVARLRGRSTVLPGADAFKLYDTYGFPLDMTELLAREQNMTVDTDGFKKLMEEQKERSRAAQKKEIIELAGDGADRLKAEFVGFDQTEGISVQICNYDLDFPADESTPPRARLYFTPTPFYGEMGGQVGDTGTLTYNGHVIRIIDTIRQGPGVICHLTHDVHLLEDFSFPATASVDSARRSLIEAHHSATHLMHWALREVLGTSVRQKGSYVGPDRLRFDFSHLEAMKPDEIRRVEDLVNERIAAALAVRWDERPYAEVKNDPTVLQFFGDKYGEVVRVVDIGGFSKELCGGTHVRNTSLIGPFHIIHEGAIAAGVRRIEAITGEALRPFLTAEFAKQDDKHAQLAQKKAPGTAWPAIDASADVNTLWSLSLHRRDLLARAEEDLRAWEKEQAKQLEAGLQSRAAELVPQLLTRVREAGPVRFIAEQIDNAPAALLTHTADALKSRFQGVVVLAGAHEGKVSLLATVSAPLAKQIPAGKIIQQIAPLVGGKGGGRPESAQGGGTRPEAIPDALAKVPSLL
jgi:alanyl-tRNA synthetase